MTVESAIDFFEWIVDDPTRRKKAQENARRSMDRVQQLQQRFMRTVPGQVVTVFTSKQGPNWAVLLAWNALTAMFPILLLLVALLGFILDFAGFNQKSLVQDLVSVMPTAAARQETLDALQGVKQHSGLFFFFGLITFLWSGSGLFSQMDQAFATIYGVQPRGFLPQKLMSVGMMLLFVVLVGLTLVSSSLLPLLKYVPLLPAALSRLPCPLGQNGPASGGPLLLSEVRF